MKLERENENPVPTLEVVQARAKFVKELLLTNRPSETNPIPEMALSVISSIENCPEKWSSFVVFTDNLINVGHAAKARALKLRYGFEDGVPKKWQAVADECYLESAQGARYRVNKLISVIRYRTRTHLLRERIKRELEDLLD